MGGPLYRRVVVRENVTVVSQKGHIGVKPNLPHLSKQQLPRGHWTYYYLIHFDFEFHYHIKMAPPSQLAIATSAVNRLVKEEASYHKELEQQQARIAKLEQGGNDDENADFIFKQEVGLSSLPILCFIL